MQISQEVREFAAKQNAGVESFVAAEGGTVDAEAGMAEMAEKLREEGGEVYIPAQ